jgi:hypothetical protein
MALESKPGKISSNESHARNYKSFHFSSPWTDDENTVGISKQLEFFSEPCTINSPSIIFVANFLRVINLLAPELFFKF